MYLYSNIEKLKKRKIELGWSNERLAEESKIPVEIINAILSGIMKDIKQETMDALVDAMDLEYYKIEDWGAGVSIIREPGAYSVRKDERATLETYYALPDYPRVELIDGEIYYMGAPSANHQILLVELGSEIRDYLKKKKGRCRVFMAPFDVCLDNDDFTMVQPDVMIICDKEKYENGIRCNGAPDFVIEIVSLSNPKHDYLRKLEKYKNAGVKEYWIVDPIKMRITAYAFEKDSLPKVYTFADKVESVTFPGFEIDFAQVSKLLV